MKKQFDLWSTAVILLTLVLFGAALFHKGFTHDMLLEAGVFLVSVKLILMAHKNNKMEEHIGERLDRIEESLRRMEKSSNTKPDGTAP